MVWPLELGFGLSQREYLAIPNVKLPTSVDLYYESHDQGEMLIFVPSTAYSGAVWKPSQMPLASSMIVIFHDPRGCGRSVASQSIYTIEQMALDIVALMEHLKLSSAHLIGHSMGGRIALSLTQNFPGKVKSLIMAASRYGYLYRTDDDGASWSKLLRELSEIAAVCWLPNAN